MWLCLKIALLTALYIFIIIIVTSFTTLIPFYQVDAIIMYPAITGFSLASVFGFKKLINSEDD